MNYQIASAPKRAFALFAVLVSLALASRETEAQYYVPEWYLADRRQVTEEEVIWLLAAHRQAVASYPGKIQDYWQPLRGAWLQSANFRKMLEKAEARWHVGGATTNTLELLDLSGCGLVDADFGQLSLRRVDLHDANLNRASFRGNGGSGLAFCSLEKADLTGTDFTRVQFYKGTARRAYVFGADFANARFDDIDLTRIGFLQTRLDGAEFKGGDLTDAHLSNNSLRYVTFSGVTITGARFDDTDVAGLIWDAQGVPDLRTLSECRNLEFLKYDRFETPLLQLRKALADAGLHSSERKMNYALHRSRLDHLWDKGSDGRGWSIWDRGEVMFQKVFFEWPSRYGLDTGKPLRLLFVLMLGCCPVYFAALVKRGAWPRAGIWAIRSSDAVRMPAKTRPVRVRLDLGRTRGVFRKLRAIWRSLVLTLFFSLQSSFTLGYKDVNVGAWIARLQAREYQLRATGWVRSVVGAQSIISVYLLALWLLTYFGRPFE